MSATNHNINSPVYQSIIHDIEQANIVLAAIARRIAREGGDTEAAIKAQIASWGNVVKDDKGQNETAMRVLVEYYQAVSL